MFKKWMVCVVIVAVFLKMSMAEEKLELIFVQMVYRHGDRSPVDLYPKDPNPKSVWPEGLGQLTMLGKKQQFNLGKFFRFYYENFTTSSPLEINVTSADHDRCLKSAQTNVASFYAPADAWKFDEGVNWQPISVYYITKPEDKYLQTTSYCPRAEVEKMRVENSPEGMEFKTKHKTMLDYVQLHSGKKFTELTDVGHLRDNIWVEMQYNLTIPEWVPPIWEELSEVHHLVFYWLFNSILLQRLRAGPQLQRMIQNMESKINGKIPELKFQIYSTHDTNIAALLLSLNLFNMRQPPYCSTLLLELYRGENATHFVRLLFLNSTEPENPPQTPHTLILDGCAEFCPLEYFINFTRHLMPGDWKKECQLPITDPQVPRDEGKILGMIFLTSFFILILVFCFAVTVWTMYKNSREKKLRRTKCS